MDFDKVIKERRSTRKFSNEKVDKNKIIEMIECARLAPSAGNRQPWHFVVLENDLKDKVANIMEKQIMGVDVTLDAENATHAYTPVASLKSSIRIIKDAPILILVFRKRSDDWLEGDYLSIGGAVEHICLKATDYGLGSLWVRDVVYTRDKIAKAVGYENLELVTGVVIGHSIEFPYERSKKKLTDIMEWKNE